MIKYDINLIKTILIHNKLCYWVLHTMSVNHNHFILYTFD